MDNYKNFDYEIGIIATIQKLNESPVEIIGKSDMQAFVTKSDLGLSLFSDKDLLDNKSPGLITVKIPTGNLNDSIYEFRIEESSLKVAIDELQLLQVFKYNVSHLESINIEQSSTYRAFYLVDDIESLYWRFETIEYQTDSTRYFHDCLRVQFAEGYFDVVHIKNNQNYYLCIESFFSNNGLKILRNVYTKLNWL